MATKVGLDFNDSPTSEAREPLIVHCGKCHHEWAPCFVPADMDVVTKALANQRCPLCRKKTPLFMGPYPKPTQEGDAVAWLANGDTGISSLTIWRVLMKRTPPGAARVDIPHDPADFGRCYRLLKVMPTWRARLPEVAEAYPSSWKSLIDAWDELTALYEEELPSGLAPKLYARMKQLRGEE